jgi:dienelactone hydrolase
MQIADFSETEFTAGKITHKIYSKGTGPDVLLMHELPGMTPECIRLGSTLADAGFAVHLPLLFGEPGDNRTLWFGVGICIRREINLFLRSGNSALLEWLRAWCRSRQNGDRNTGIGVIGLCLTGNFAISLLADANVLAPVASEPALPFGLGRTARSCIGVSDDDLALGKTRNATGVPLMCLRFSNDRLSPRARFAAIQEAYPIGFRGIEIDSSAGNPNGISSRAHSVLTEDFRDQAGHPTRAALDQVIAFLRERLMPAPTLT